MIRPSSTRLQSHPGKRVRLRDMGLWAVDPPEYFQGAFVTVDLFGTPEVRLVCEVVLFFELSPLLRDTQTLCCQHRGSCGGLLLKCLAVNGGCLAQPHLTHLPPRFSDCSCHRATDAVLCRLPLRRQFALPKGAKVTIH